MTNKFLLWSLGILFIILVAGAGIIYNQVAVPKYFTKEKTKRIDLYVASGSSYQDLCSLIQDSFPKTENFLFKSLARKMKLQKHVYPGKYELHQPISLLNLIRAFRSGKRATVRLTILPKWKIEESLTPVSSKIEADSIKIINALLDMGFPNEQTLLPNTYEFYWNTSATQFAERMILEADQYWNDENRQLKLRTIGLNKIEAYILASIVYRETNINEEMPKIAGVYLNRLRKGIALQADPTIKFAVGNLGLKRILNKHLVVESPYNTYLYQGLPPGPISIPSIQSIEAVLNAEEHNYLYFCAKPDYSGQHHFAETYRAHINNAKRFHQWLNKQNIR